MMGPSVTTDSSEQIITSRQVNYPPGCILYYDDVKFYSDMSNTGNCGYSSTRGGCVCSFSGPSCAITDGSKANDASNCVCGGSTCTSITGFFCFASVSRCSTTSELTVSAPCSYSECPSSWSVATSPIDGGSNQDKCVCEFTGHPCSHATGLEENASPCVCGHTACTKSTGMFCFSDRSYCRSEAIFVEDLTSDESKVRCETFKESGDCKRESHCTWKASEELGTSSTETKSRLFRR